MLLLVWKYHVNDYVLCGKRGSMLYNRIFLMPQTNKIFTSLFFPFITILKV